ncbi:MAG: stage II sporulation protein R [Oscillospiraceae bacterium]|nr:stage II sporulation protein R [Oscillospiraceae bacterium]
MKDIFMTIVLIIGIVISLTFAAFETFSADCGNVRGEVLRLHIPANSDSGEDQAVKLELRDFLLAEYGGELSGSVDLSAAKEHARELLPEIERRCTEFLREHGFDYGAKAELTDMYFTTREYDRLILPAGEYTALRITLGSGEGHNWWCVIFPQLCLPAVSEQHEKDDNAESVLETFGKPQKITVKFAVYEWIQRLFS